VVLLPILLGLLLATVLWPAARALRKRGVPDALAAIGVLLLALLLLFGVVGGLAPQVTGQAQELADQVTAGLGELENRLTGRRSTSARTGWATGRERHRGAAGQRPEHRRPAAERRGGRPDRCSHGAAVARCCASSTSRTGRSSSPGSAALVGPRAAPHVRRRPQRSWVTLSGFIKAQAAVGLVDAVFIGVGLAVLGVPLALPLAVLVFFGAFIPIIGAVVSGALAALVALVTSGPTSALIVVALVLVVQQLEGNVLQPILVGRTLDLHPAAVILAVTAGGTLAGSPAPSWPCRAVGRRRRDPLRPQQLAEVEPGRGRPRGGRAAGPGRDARRPRRARDASKPAA
jgi:hypothetical protein